MCYEQMHALVTAILMAGQLANSASEPDNISDLARTARAILKQCDFVPRDEWMQRVAK